MAESDPSETRVRSEGPEARAGETSGHVRIVLGISLTLAILILSAIVWGPALFNH
ncbi:hypothetical protein [Sphingomonas sp.]|jgi:hypothetical protein|uniref:hypothetical protein n=1 Tax=Sphingomonas sp. TaxID=28214 RepID=UPI002E30F89A|nr:hypothetical protein [Sphingomonas sp.]HEX4695835.1 hypothetical protein [Sphingomonas sp.]